MQVVFDISLSVKIELTQERFQPGVEVSGTRLQSGFVKQWPGT